MASAPETPFPRRSNSPQGWPPLGICADVSSGLVYLRRYPLAQYPYAQGTILYVDPSNLQYTVQVRSYLLCVAPSRG